MKACTTIPEQAVKAALDAFLNTARTADGIKAALTAAAPHMRYKREFNISGCTVDLSGADYKRFLDGVTGFEVYLDEETRSFGGYNEGDRVFFDVETGNLDAHNLFILSRPAFEKKVQERISALEPSSASERAWYFKAGEDVPDWLEAANKKSIEITFNVDCVVTTNNGYFEIRPQRSRDLSGPILKVKNKGNIEGVIIAGQGKGVNIITYGLFQDRAREQALPSELIRKYVEDYEWRADSGDYTPNNTERAMIEDAIAGYASYVDEVLSSSAREEETKDYEAIGQAYMNAFDVLTSEDTEWNGYTPAECPTEFLMDVFWTQQKQKSAREQALEEAAQWYEKQRQKWLEMNIGLPDFAPEIRALKPQPAQTGGGE